MTLLPDFNQPRYNGGLFGTWTEPRYPMDEGGVFGNGRLYPDPRPPVWGEPGHEPWQRFPGSIDPGFNVPSQSWGIDPGFNIPSQPSSPKIAGRFMSNIPMWPGLLGGLIGAGIKFINK